MNNINFLMELLNTQKQNMDLLISEYNKSHLEIKSEIEKLSKIVKEEKRKNENYNQDNLGDQKRVKKINWADLTVKLLTEENRLMASNEILEYLFSREAKERKLELSLLLSSALYKLCENGKISKYIHRPRKNYYGLVDWFEIPITPFDVPDLKEEYKMSFKKKHLKEDAF
jgi:predicted nucleotidyltransferase